MLKAGYNAIIELSALLITLMLVQVYWAGGLGMKSLAVSVTVFLSVLIFIKVCVYSIGKVINAKK
ncbi:hypothetical protein [Pseudoalteromonas sp.]|uniref:hypothetical protein n=1 Tax=Pseudoalteromonas sp. TaxID=53249 RepID=UPI00356A65C8